MKSASSARSSPRVAAAGRADVRKAVDALRSVIQQLRVSGRAVEQELGISGAQLSILQELADTPAQSVNELAGNTYTHQSSVSTVVRRLIDKDLVHRTSVENDARRVSLSITAAGRAIVRKAPASSRSRLIRGLENLSRADTRALAASLERLAKSMTNHSS